MSEGSSDHLDPISAIRSLTFCSILIFAVVSSQMCFTERDPTPVALHALLHTDRSNTLRMGNMTRDMLLLALGAHRPETL